MRLLIYSFLSWIAIIEFVIAAITHFVILVGMLLPNPQYINYIATAWFVYFFTLAPGLLEASRIVWAYYGGGYTQAYFLKEYFSSLPWRYRISILLNVIYINLVYAFARNISDWPILKMLKPDVFSGILMLIALISISIYKQVLPEWLSAMKDDSK